MLVVHITWVGGFRNDHGEQCLKLKIKIKELLNEKLIIIVFLYGKMPIKVRIL